MSTILMKKNASIILLTLAIIHVTIMDARLSSAVAAHMLSHGICPSQVHCHAAQKSAAVTRAPSSRPCTWRSMPQARLAHPRDRLSSTEQQEGYPVAAPEEWLEPTSAAASLACRHLELLLLVCPRVERATLFVPSPGASYLGSQTLILLTSAGGERAHVRSSGAHVQWSELAGSAPRETLVGGPEGASCAADASNIIVPLMGAKVTIGWVVLTERHGGSNPHNVGTYRTAWHEDELAGLCKVIECLAVALSLLLEEKRSSELALDDVRAVLSDALTNISGPLSALRTFGKLLVRRLQRLSEHEAIGAQDGGLSVELAKNVLIQSDELADVLSPLHSALGLSSDEEGLVGSLQVPDFYAVEATTTTEVEPQADEVFDEPPPRLYDLLVVLNPIIRAAEAVALREGASFDMYIEEDLPSLSIEPRQLQEALALLVDHAIRAVFTPSSPSGAGTTTEYRPSAVHMDVRTASVSEEMGLRAVCILIGSRTGGGMWAGALEDSGFLTACKLIEGMGGTLKAVKEHDRVALTVLLPLE